MNEKIVRALTTDRPYWLFVIFLIWVYLTGGSARNDTQALALLRPVAVMFFAIAVWQMRKNCAADAKLLLAGCAALAILSLLYIIPLPASIWTALPGRDLISQIDAAAGLGDVTRAAAISPRSAINAALALIVPITALMLLIEVDRAGSYKLLPLLIGLGLASGLIGILQSIGNPQGPLYFYQITNNGSAVGIFANRNHQAVFLAMLFPMLAAYTAMSKFQKSDNGLRFWLCCLAGSVLVPLILATGSRSGLLLGLAGLLSSVWIYRSTTAKTKGAERKGHFLRDMVIGGIGISLLVAATIFMSRAQAVDRIFGFTDSESRTDFWQPILVMAHKYAPAGAGPGSFDAGFAAIEPDALLDSTYLNHAHNDWLELYGELGFPGVAVVIAFLLALVLTYIQQKKDAGFRSGTTSKLGISLIALALFASVTDYSLRTPFLATVAMIALVWIFPSRHDDAKKLKG